VLERFRKGERAAILPEKKSRPADDTIRLLAEGRSFQEIAAIRGRQLRSVIDLVATLVEKGELQFQNGWIDESKRASIEEACSRLGMERLKPIKEALPEEITYEEIRLVAAHLRREQEKTA
jgi:ATP-dependent DNA helicase RecQ